MQDCYSITWCLPSTLGSSPKCSQSLFYRYYFSKCSSEMAQLVPLPYSWGRSTHYSDRLHDFSVTIPTCCQDIYVRNMIFAFFTGVLIFQKYIFQQPRGWRNPKFFLSVPTMVGPAGHSISSFSFLNIPQTLVWYVNSFLPCTAILWNSHPQECFPLTWSKWL